MSAINKVVTTCDKCGKTHESESWHVEKWVHAHTTFYSMNNNFRDTKRAEISINLCDGCFVDFKDTLEIAKSFAKGGFHTQ